MSLLNSRFYFAEQCPQTHIYNSESRFAYNTAAHFGNTFLAFGKYNGYLFYFKPEGKCRKFHFDLECIAFKFNTIEIDGLQYFTGVAFKAGRSIADGHACNKTYIYAGVVREQYAAYRPVYHVNPGYVTRTYGYIGTLDRKSVV